MRRGLVAGLIAATALAASGGVARAMQPPSSAEIAQEQFDQVVTTFDQALAKQLRGGTFSPTTADSTATTVLDVAREKHLSMQKITMGDDGKANSADVSLLINSYRSDAGFVVRGVNVVVIGCVRFSVSHGKAGWEPGDAQVTSRSIPCPAGSTAPETDETVWAGDVPERSFPIGPRSPA